MPGEGATNNPHGRPIGQRNRRTKEAIEKIFALGLKDPLQTLAELQDHSADEGIRATAASMLAPFIHSKNTPRAEPRFVEAAPELPPLNSLSNAIESIAILQSAVASNQLDVQSAQDLISMINAYIAGKNVQEAEIIQHRLDEIEANLAALPPQPQHVIGGLPPLPGSSIIFNGNTGPAIDHTEPIPDWANPDNYSGPGDCADST